MTQEQNGLVEALDERALESAWLAHDNACPGEHWRKRERMAAGIRAYLAALQAPQEAGVESIESYFARQIEWSRNTFGPALRTNGVIDHIRKELMEIEAEPHDLSEWIDVVILAMDGFWRHGGSAADLLPRLLAKQAKNMARTWPDWRTLSEDSAIEHDRSGEALSQPVATPAPSQDAAVAESIAAMIHEWYDSAPNAPHIPAEIIVKRLSRFTRPAEAQTVAEGWRDMASAPKDGTKILVKYDAASDPYVEDEKTGRLTPYGAHSEGGEFLDGTGVAVAIWVDGWHESEDEYGSGYWMPGWWFAWFNGDAELAVAPTGWMPLPAASPATGGA